MTVTYDRDDDKRRIVVKVAGPFDLAAALAIVAHLAADDSWSVGILYDTHDLAGLPSMTELQTIVDRVQSVTAQRPRGPVAVVTSNRSAYEMAEVYLEPARGQGQRRRVPGTRRGPPMARWLPLRLSWQLASRGPESEPMDCRFDRTGSRSSPAPNAPGLRHAEACRCWFLPRAAGCEPQPGSRRLHQGARSRGPALGDAVFSIAR